MVTIGSLLEKKGTNVWTVYAGATVYDGLVSMAERGVGALPVLDDGQKLVGIVSERDYARKIVLKGKDSKNTLVREIMTPVEDMYCVSADTTAEEGMVLITTKKIRHLPVFDNHKFIGLISIGDLVKSVIADKEHTIEQLNNYISGKYV